MAYGVPFDKFYSLTEGQQADEYKARKAKEAEDEKKKDINGVSRSRTGLEYVQNYRKAKEAEGKELSNSEEDEAYNKKHMTPIYYSKSVENASKQRYDRTGKYFSQAEYDRATDAYNRHYRRTHKNESSIFESVEIV